MVGGLKCKEDGTRDETHTVRVLVPTCMRVWWVPTCKGKYLPVAKNRSLNIQLFWTNKMACLEDFASCDATKAPYNTP